jgi:hypothetical protein
MYTIFCSKRVPLVIVFIDGEAQVGLILWAFTLYIHVIEAVLKTNSSSCWKCIKKKKGKERRKR